MAGVKEIVPQLVACLRDELTHIEAFTTLLQREREALLSNNTDAIFSLAEEKKTTAKILQRCADKRIALLAPFVPNGIQQHNSLPKILLPEHKALWQKFLAVTKQAHELNQQNGIIIKDRMHNNQRALSILLAANQLPTTYGPDGQTRTRPSGRLLGSV